MVKATDLNLSSQVSVSLVSAGSNPAGVVTIEIFFPLLTLWVCWTLDETSIFFLDRSRGGGERGEA